MASWLGDMVRVFLAAPVRLSVHSFAACACACACCPDGNKVIFSCVDAVFQHWRPQRQDNSWVTTAPRRNVPIVAQMRPRVTCGPSATNEACGLMTRPYIHKHSLPGISWGSRDA
ncbi:unnamed protein product, partial [Ectocarpus sp. 13 AM-2016]